MAVPTQQVGIRGWASLTGWLPDLLGGLFKNSLPGACWEILVSSWVQGPPAWMENSTAQMGSGELLSFLVILDSAVTIPGTGVGG